MEILSLNEILPYIEYGVICLQTDHVDTGKPYYGGPLSTKLSIYNIDLLAANLQFFKPILKPLSALTKEDFIELFKIEEGENFNEEEYREIKITEMCNTFWGKGKNFILGFDLDLKSFYMDAIEGDNITVINQWSLFQYLLKNHFDIFKLLKRDLALNKLDYPHLMEQV